MNSWICESRHHDRAVHRDFDCIFRFFQILNPASWPDGNNSPILDKDRAVLDYPQITQRRTAAYAIGSTQSQQLLGPAKQE